MTTFSQKSLLLMFFYSVVIGAFLGFIYGFFRIRRVVFSKVFHSIKKETSAVSKVRKAENIVIFFEDVLFFFIAATVNIIFIYHVNFGIIRIFSFVGEISGFIIYYFTLGKLFTVFAEYVIMLTGKVIFNIYNACVLPVMSLMFFLLRYTVGFVLGVIYTRFAVLFDSNKIIKKSIYTINSGDVKNERKIKHIR